ncbi:MAG TPA: FlgD immunoglobulin-like domain containing protein [Candidatus Eisenbacteria bacterium]|jgi:hypothetical protein
MADGKGGAFVAWRDQRDSASTGYDIYAQRIDGAGVAQWTPNGVPVCSLPRDQINPHLVADGADGVILAWQDLRGGAHYDLYAQRIGPTGALLWPAAGVRLRNSSFDQYLTSPPHSSIASDGAGGAIVAWSEYVTGTNTDVRAQRVDGSGAVRWTSYGVAVCTAVSFQDDPTLVSDGVGGVILAWEDWRFWPVPHIYAQRLSASGQGQWAADGIAGSSLAGDQRDPSLIPDEDGGALFAYQDNRQGDHNVYAQRVDAMGQFRWAADGVPLCTAPGPQSRPSLAGDGGGGAVVAWEDGRSNPSCVGGCYWDVYAQHVDATGVPQWTPDGVGLSTAEDDQEQPRLVGDGAGGTIAVWADSRGFLTDQIYGQHLDPLGTPQWAPDGVALTSGGGSPRQWGPVAVTDGAGGAIVVWTDNRGGACGVDGCFPTDLYAAPVTSSGPLAVPGPGAPALRLLAPHPNPMATTTSIGFSLPTARRLTVEIFDLTGQRVRTLASGREYPAGTHTLSWEGRTDAGRALPSGVYVLRLSTAGATERRKIVLLR